MSHFSPDIIACRLTRLRQNMVASKMDAVLVPSSDPHLSEYLPGRWQGRQWLSGFTGSAGTLIVTADFAGVWTDGRYWEQAEVELNGTGIEVMKILPGAGPAYIGWLAQHLTAGQTVAVDGYVLGLSLARSLQQALDARGIALAVNADPLAAVWEDRPALPASPIVEHAVPYATTNRREKLERLRAAMRQTGANMHLISALDDIAYLFNLRGADVEFNPVFVAHALIGLQRATLFVEDGKISPALRDLLADDGVDIAPYAGVQAALSNLPAESTTVLLDPRKVTLGIRQSIGNDVSVVDGINPTTLAKAIKTEAEAAHIRMTMIEDGAALCEFFAWLEHAVTAPGYGEEAGLAPLTEFDIETRLLDFRSRRPGFVSPSFGTIAGFNSNGAIMHYRATAAHHRQITGDGLLLIDSGGQYLGGTTDITRMVPIGAVSAEQRRDCTLVLKALIALSSAQFPHRVKSPMLDAIARAPIWAAGIDYAHGTGHGVGYFLNVHEGPQSISCSSAPEPATAMELGMVTSVEPGIYRPGRWGVRIENLVLNQPGCTGEFGEFLRFETLTLCPIDTRCLELALLRQDERAWLNTYHDTVRRKLLPLLAGEALAWLVSRTEAV
jgi:Xaa-Pro aminopeptidase